MLEEQILNLFDFLNTPDGKLWAVAFSVCVPSVALVVYFLNRKNTQPILTWIALSTAFFLLSQTFPENRTQMKELCVGAFVGGGLLTWSVVRLLGKRKRSNAS